MPQQCSCTSPRCFAISESDRSRDPDEWIAAQLDLADLLAHGRSTPDVAALNEAAIAMRPRPPNCLVAARRTFASKPRSIVARRIIRSEPTAETWGISNALSTSFDAALDDRFREIPSLQRALIQSELGAALVMLDILTDEPTRTARAVGSLRAALSVFTAADTPREWATTQQQLGTAL